MHNHYIHPLPKTRQSGCAAADAGLRGTRSITIERKRVNGQRTTTEEEEEEKEEDHGGSRRGDKKTTAGTTTTRVNVTLAQTTRKYHQ